MTQEKAQQLNLTIGEPLTEQQRAQLTEDTIWYVKQEVQLPNGETIESLVPQIFYCNTTLARLEQERILNTAGSMLAGTNVILQTKPNSTDNINNTDNTDDTIFNTILSNSGTITAKNTLAITGFDTISNVTSSIRNDDINSLSQDKFNNQATLTAGNTLIIDTGVNGTVNNLSGMIALNNTNDNTSSTQNSLYDNLLYINTGTLNNITLSQQETVEKQTHSKKNDYIEPYCNLTVNLDMQLGKGLAFIDVNNADRDLLLFLEEQGFIAPTGVTMPSGFVVYPLYRLNLDKIGEYKF